MNTSLAQRGNDASIVERVLMDGDLSPLTPEQKVCSACHIAKPTTDFYKSRGVLNAKCKTCHKAQTVAIRRRKNKPKPTMAERFEAKINRIEGGCWEWTGGKTTAGYGIFQTGTPRPDGKHQPEYAHRLSYEMNVGSIPEDMTIDHLCRNRGCVNPAHLEVVTLHVNILRSNGMSARHAASEFCIRGHPKTEENTYVSPSGKHTDCRLCRQERWKAWSQNRRK